MKILYAQTSACVVVDSDEGLSRVDCLTCGTAATLADKDVDAWMRKHYAKPHLEPIGQMPDGTEIDPERL